jgi:hypothetical protein
MATSKTRSHGRHRLAMAPGLESLEGRQLLSAAGAQIRIAEVTTNGVTDLRITGTPKADIVNISDDGTTNAGNITVKLGNGTTYTSKSAISMIQVMTLGGNDQVSYHLTGDLMGARTVNTQLGAGNDQFTANIDGAIRTTGVLDLESYGDAGNDNMVINQTGSSLAGVFFPYMEGDGGNDTLAFNSTSNISQGATVAPVLLGGAGNDTISLRYAGLINGEFLHNLTIDGGAGNDNVSANVTVASGSTGSVGNSATTTAIVLGGDGNDQVKFAIAIDPTVSSAQVHAIALGNAGVDGIQRTSNVQGDSSNDNDAIL